MFMASEWFLNVAEKIYGPFDAGNLKQFVQEGRITPDTLIRKGQEGPWVAARQVRGLFEPVSQDSPNAEDDLTPVEVVEVSAAGSASLDGGRGAPRADANAVLCNRCGEPAHPNQYQCLACGSLLHAPLPQQVPDNTLGGLIPTKNAKSLWAYYLGFLSLFACIPLIGILIGLPAAVAALVMGIKARRYAIEFPEAKGGIHAWVGILMGLASLIVGILLQTLMVIGIIANILGKR
jgi:hypothetical protein